MCIGIPMQVVEPSGEMALCEGMGRTALVDFMLLGEQPAGSWVLVFMDTAREVLTAEQAKQINDALLAVQLAMQGESQVDDLFADLVNREPQLPEFLR